jgi:S-adenosylmethionine synthetase
MTKSLRERAEQATQEVQQILGLSAEEHPKEISDAIEKTIIHALLEERHRCADVAFEFLDEDQVKAKHVAEEIRRINTVLVSNLSSMR